MSKTIIHVDLDDTLCLYTEARNSALEDNPRISYPQSQYGFFRNLAPIGEGVSVVRNLIKDSRYEVHILTAPSYKNPLCYTEKRDWVEKYFGEEFCKHLIICHNKGLIKGDYLIDDNIEGKGQENFEGEVLQIKDYQEDWKYVAKLLGVLGI